ncbi:MAG: hypothetical protein Q6363_008155 [Candidatus Njordarchaeota archaeon]
MDDNECDKVRAILAKHFKTCFWIRKMYNVDMYMIDSRDNKFFVVAEVLKNCDIRLLLFFDNPDINYHINIAEIVISDFSFWDDLTEYPDEEQLLRLIRLFSDALMKIPQFSDESEVNGDG